MYCFTTVRARGSLRGNPTRKFDMTKFTVHTVESAPALSRPLLEGIKRVFGFVPNLYAVFAESPAALQGALSIGEAYANSSLSPVEQ